MVRWLTGHAFLGLQNFRCGTVVTSFCRLCGQVPERADHLLLRCPRLAGLRAECFRSWSLDYRPQWEVDWILKFLGDPAVSSLEDPTNCPEEISGFELPMLWQSRTSKKGALSKDAIFGSEMVNWS